MGCLSKAHGAEIFRGDDRLETVPDWIRL